MGYRLVCLPYKLWIEGGEMRNYRYRGDWSAGNIGSEEWAYEGTSKDRISTLLKRIARRETSNGYSVVRVHDGKYITESKFICNKWITIKYVGEDVEC